MGDLPRVMRVPGTLNMKHGSAAPSYFGGWPIHRVESPQLRNHIVESGELGGKEVDAEHRTAGMNESKPIAYEGWVSLDDPAVREGICPLALAWLEGEDRAECGPGHRSDALLELTGCLVHCGVRREDIQKAIIKADRKMSLRSLGRS